MKNFVITITKDYGSDGSIIAEKIASRLQVPCYGRNILRLASEESGISEELFARYDEKLGPGKKKKKDPVFCGEVMKPGEAGFVSEENIFNYQARVLRHLAMKESFVMVGRGSNYVLRTFPNAFHVGIHASMEAKIIKVMKSKEINRKEASALIMKKDREFAEYYRYFTGIGWMRMEDFDLFVNSTRNSIEDCVDMILAAAGTKLNILEETRHGTTSV